MLGICMEEGTLSECSICDHGKHHDLNKKCQKEHKCDFDKNKKVKCVLYVAGPPQHEE